MLPSRPRGKHSCAPPFCLFGVAFPFCSFTGGGGGGLENGQQLAVGKEGGERGAVQNTARQQRAFSDRLCSSRPPARPRCPRGPGSSQARAPQRASSCPQEEAVPDMRGEHAPLGSTCARGEHERSGSSESGLRHAPLVTRGRVLVCCVQCNLDPIGTPYYGVSNL